VLASNVDVFVVRLQHSLHEACCSSRRGNNGQWCGYLIELGLEPPRQNELCQSEDVIAVEVSDEHCIEISKSKTRFNQPIARGATCIKLHHDILIFHEHAGSGATRCDGWATSAGERHCCCHVYDLSRDDSVAKKAIFCGGLSGQGAKSPAQIGAVTGS
jgi:hypothetical protein